MIAFPAKMYDDIDVDKDHSVETMLNDLATYGIPTLFKCNDEGDTWYCKLEYKCRSGLSIKMESTYNKVGLREVVLQCKEQLVTYLTEENP